jgi:hypothetical protein
MSDVPRPCFNRLSPGSLFERRECSANASRAPGSSGRGLFGGQRILGRSSHSRCGQMSCIPASVPTVWRAERPGTASSEPLEFGWLRLAVLAEVAREREIVTT